MDKVQLASRLPGRLSRLADLSANLWWSWTIPARELFESIDGRLWRSSGHNPVRLLSEVEPRRLESLAADEEFLGKLDSVIELFDRRMSDEKNWVTKTYPGVFNHPVAYFSMEFAVHNSLPMYAGGLGVLAGDICKEASDLGLPFVGVGFMYPEGYFHQRISEDGWQIEHYRQLDFDLAPISRVTQPDGSRFLLSLLLGNKNIYLTAWEVKVGRGVLYLLDTNVPENEPGDRELSARLYSAGREIRLQQEYLLGIGGVRLLRALGINPVAWHCNEGHTSFLLLELLRERLTAGDSLESAIEKVRDQAVFTTHTPVPAGHDTFDPALMDRYFCCYWDSLKIERDEFLSLGQASPDEYFNMTVLGLKLSRRANAVSRLHGEVSRKMWRRLYGSTPESAVPIGHITNGIHVPTWETPPLTKAFEKYIGNDWYDRRHEIGFRDLLNKVPDEVLWQAHQFRKQRLIHLITERSRQEWSNAEVSSRRLVALGALMDPDVLTIGFVRRFVEYKRPSLLFRDVERLKKIVRNWQRPVQFIFAGKSHPADFMAKELIHRVYSQATDREFEGRVCFIEDYDLHLARYLVSGVDVWLNNPRRLLEASGTSGMKAGINGVPNASILDGWWQEGFNGKNGWAIGSEEKPENPLDEDSRDASDLYQLLEEQILPMYYDRDVTDSPRRWLKVMREAIASTVWEFSASRMMIEYVEQMYLPIARSLIGK
ncbi:starch phosphorylase [Dehalogenimonas formicexedens]|uniref:Starch phosphorylase n=1 Tax=Dehalogenimonas formicexedens TaxID=1839801 RepID=A0A1P8F7J5_9CHLR|nr:alpha-glucan family phosphorylase [Dehalogenimonas formicexedens]APV44449.1 starch phosphorylase [Dehalogenimonas formicexedens]